MNSTHPILDKSLGFARLTGLGLLLALPLSAQTGDDITELEAVTITGTRLSGAAAEGMLSVTPLSKTLLDEGGFPNVGDMLRTKLPQLGGPGVLNEAFGNGGSGESLISLRGLPGSRTLVLVNGRRVSSEDLNLIPEGAIERIEVLNDGASAIYGSDAVAGVVNVILKTKFSGAELNAYYGNTFDTDISVQKYSFTVGDITERGNFVMSGDYSKSNGMLSFDREVSRPLPNAVSGTSNPGTFIWRQVPAGQIPLRWGVNPANADAITSASQIPAAFDPLATVASVPGESAVVTRNREEAARNALLPPNSPVMYGVPSLMPGLDPGFPFPVYTILYRPHENYGFYGSAEYKLLPDSNWAKVFFSGYYKRNQSLNILAPSPLANRTVTENNYWMAQVFPALVGTGNTFRFDYRPVEAGPRITYNDFESIHLVTGLRGDIADTRWTYEVGFLWDRRVLNQTQTGGILATAYNTALGGTTAATAFNPFGYTAIGSMVSPANSADIVNPLISSATAQEILKIRSFDFNVAGPVLELPAGDWMVSVGAETRRENYDWLPDFAIRTGAVFPFNISETEIGAVKIDSLYAETDIPVLGDVNDPDSLKLALNLAARYEDYKFNLDMFGLYPKFNTSIKPRYAFRFAPFGEELTIRGSYAEGFVAPGIADLLPTSGQSFTELTNPLTGTRRQPIEAVLLVGNPNLKPAESKSMLIGGTYSPKALEGLTVGLQYYRIKESGIPYRSEQYIVDEWYRAGPTNPSNPFGPNAAPSAQNPLGAQVEVDTFGELVQVRNIGPINSGKRVTDGLDFNFEYGMSTDIGKFTLRNQTTYVLTFKQENFPGAGMVDYLGKYWAPGAALSDVGFPKWRATTSVTYEWDKLSAVFAWNFSDGYLETDDQSNNFAGNAVRKVETYQTFDLSVSYALSFLGTTKVTVGINNLLDEQPPQVVSTFGDGYDRRLTDIRGRYYFISLKQQF